MVSKNIKGNEIAGSTISSEVCDNDDKKIKKPETWRLYTFEEAPAFLRLNHFIRTGYRARLSYSWCIRSLFKVHNETMNCWTHLLSLLIFVGLSIHTLFIFLDKHAPNNTSLTYFFFDPAGSIPIGDSMLLHRVIFALYFIAAQGCFLSSTMYHLFSCHSEHTMCSVARLDYSGISGLILFSFYPPVYYLFYCFPAYQALYLGSITFLGLLGMFGPLFSFFHAHWFHPFRVLLFVGTTCSGFVPGIHANYIPQLDKLGYNLGADVPAFEECFYLLLAMFVLYGIGFVFYITKVPERFFPGKFDHWFHSHSIWHIFVFAATYAHYLNCVKLFERWNAQQDSCPVIVNSYYGL